MLNSKGETPLSLAAAKANPVATRILLDAKAMVHLRTAEGWTALHFVANRNQEDENSREVACLLIAAGAKNHRLQDIHGRSPLDLQHLETTAL